MKVSRHREYTSREEFHGAETLLFAELGSIKAGGLASQYDRPISILRIARLDRKKEVSAVKEVVFLSVMAVCIYGLL